MAGLRTLLDFPTAGSGATIDYNVLRVYNTSIDSAENGGCCCQWTVPAGVSWFAIEMWGGGGGGSGACCCFAGWPGGSGSYARKIVTENVVEGNTFRICAAGSTGCSQCHCFGCQGYPSYVYDEQAGYNITCASGGQSGCARCFFYFCNCQGCSPKMCGSYCGSFGICGITGSAKGSPMCSGSVYQFMPSAPFTYGYNRVTKDGCSGYCGGCCVGGYAHFPGGGGATAMMHTSTMYCGAAGAGGLVQIYYPVASS